MFAYRSGGELAGRWNRRFLFFSPPGQGTGIDIDTGVEIGVGVGIGVGTAYPSSHFPPSTSLL